MKLHSRAWPLLGTIVELHAHASSEAAFLAASSAAQAELQRIHALMSRQEPASDVSRINRLRPGERCDVDAHTAAVLHFGCALQHASAGAFRLDCTDAAAQPAAGPVIACDGTSVRRIARGAIDLGGIAKGYAVDCAVAVLQRHGIASALVNAGGDLRAFGPHDWPVQLRRADDPHGRGERIALRDAALATSAAYADMSGFHGDAHGGHWRGAPPCAAPRSVTIIAADCISADALTKVALAQPQRLGPLLPRYRARVLAACTPELRDAA